MPKKKCNIFLPPILVAFPTLLVFFVLGFCVSFKGAILATQCHGYIVPTLFNVVPSVTVMPYGVINVAILRALHATLWSLTLTGRYPTFHILRFTVRHVHHFSPPVNSGLLDFMWWPAFLLLIPAGPQLQALDRSVPRRTTTADSGSKCSLPDLHRKLRIRMFPAGPLNSTLEKIKMKH